MTPEQFRDWRKSLRLTQAEAAQHLGVSKRSVFNYEAAGPVPDVVALACKAVSNDLAGHDIEKLVKDQYPALGEFVIVLPLVVERASNYVDAVAVTLTKEAESWAQEKTPSLRFSMRTVITADLKRLQAAVACFDTIAEATYFKLRWS